MNGPTWSFKLEKGQEVEIPAGYGFLSGNLFGGQYHYQKMKFQGIAEIKKQKSLVAEELFIFKSDEEFVCVKPSISTYESRIDINLSPLARGKTIDECLSDYCKVSFSMQEDETTGV